MSRTNMIAGLIFTLSLVTQQASAADPYRVWYMGKYEWPKDGSIDQDTSQTPNAPHPSSKYNSLTNLDHNEIRIGDDDFPVKKTKQPCRAKSVTDLKGYLLFENLQLAGSRSTYGLGLKYEGQAGEHTYYSVSAETKLGQTIEIYARTPIHQEGTSQPDSLLVKIRGANGDLMRHFRCDFAVDN